MVVAGERLGRHQVLRGTVAVAATEGRTASRAGATVAFQSTQSEEHVHRQTWWKRVATESPSTTTATTTRKTKKITLQTEKRERVSQSFTTTRDDRRNRDAPSVVMTEKGPRELSVAVMEERARASERACGVSLRDATSKTEGVERRSTSRRPNGRLTSGTNGSSKSGKQRVSSVRHNSGARSTPTKWEPLPSTLYRTLTS